MTFPDLKIRILSIPIEISTSLENYIPNFELSSHNVNERATILGLFLLSEKPQYFLWIYL